MKKLNSKQRRERRAVFAHFNQETFWRNQHKQFEMMARAMKGGLVD